MWARPGSGEDPPLFTDLMSSGLAGNLSASGASSSWVDFEQIEERQSEDSGRDDHGDGPVDA